MIETPPDVVNGGLTTRGRTHRLGQASGVAVTVAVITALLTGCSSTPKTIVKTVPAPTVTVTVPGPTATVTKHLKMRVVRTVTAQPTPTLATAMPVATPAADNSFDRGYAISVTGNIITDLKSVDHRLGDGGAVSSGLMLLSGDYGRLLNAGVPPTVDAANYKARINTLESFASTAADEYDVNATQGSARYEVVRQQTAPLFQQLNPSLGTQFALPARP